MSITRMFRTHRSRVVSHCAASVILSRVLTGLCVATPVRAQRPAPDSATAVNPAPVVPFADPRETRNRPGHGAFALPQSYGQCVAAIHLARREAAQQDSSQDTLPESLKRPRPLPAPVQAMGESCRTRVAAQPVLGLGMVPAPAELQSAFELAVLLGDSMGSVAALDRWLAAPQTLGDRGESSFDTRLKRVMTAVTLYYDIDAPVALRAWSLAYGPTVVARLDSMGPRAHAARLTTQFSIVEAATEWRNQLAGTFAEPARVLHDYMALIPAFDSATPEELASKYGGTEGFITLGIRQAQSLLDEQRVLPLLDSLATHPSLNGNIGKEAADESARWKWMNVQAGHPVPPLHAQFWFHTQGDTVWPVPGHISLLVMGDIAESNALFLRRLAHRYTSHGLRMTFVNKTNGYWTRSGTATGPRTAAQEAAQDSAYYLDYLKLPATVAIVETPFVTQPGGHVVQRTPVEYERDWGGTAGLVLVDPSGRLLKRWEVFDEREVIAYLDHLFDVQTP